MSKNLIIWAAILGILAVILGAFAAHGLKELINTSSIETFNTGIRYQMYHALFLLFIGATPLINDKVKKQILYTTLLGILLFSGSIYGLSTNELTTFDFKSIGFITPIGGLLFIISWVILLINIMKSKVE